MTASDPKADLHRYLQDAREALLWKLDGLTEYDVRRPMVPTGTNLLGLVKHVASVELGYFGDCFGRPYDEPLPWLEDAAEYVVDTYRDEITSLISETVAGWDADDASRKIEANVGRDLQFIRINGTVVGALAGLLIHVVSVLV